MLKRLMFLLFGIYGVINIETHPDVKIVVIHWRVKCDPREYTPADMSNIAKNIPAGWQVLLITERW